MKVSRTILIVLLVIAIGVVGLYLSGFICYGSFPYLDKTMIEPIPIWLIIIVTLFWPISTMIAEDGLYLGYAIHNNTQKKKLNVLLSAFLCIALSLFARWKIYTLPIFILFTTDNFHLFLV